MKPKRKMAKVGIALKPHSVKGEFWLIFETGHHPTILWLKWAELVRLKKLIERYEKDIPNAMKKTFRLDIEKPLKLADVVKQLSAILKQKPDATVSVFDMDATPIGGLIDKLTYDPDNNRVVIETVWNY